jgi:hypothetical protein
MMEPVYPRAGSGWPSISLGRMLRTDVLLNWFNLSAPAVEEPLCDSLLTRNFVGVDLGRKGGLDDTTVCKFRYLLEATVSMTTPFSLTGRPVVVSPAGVEDSLPIGLQFFGRRWQEEALLADCSVIEAVLRGYVPQPLAGASD